MLVLLSLVARAQGLDGHGFVLAPSDQGLDDLLTMWHPERPMAHTGAAEVAVEYADEPLVLVGTLGSQPYRAVVVDDLIATNLGGTYAVSDRFAVAATLPVFLASRDEDGVHGPALGDVRLAVPSAIHVADDGLGFGLSAVPFVDLPTGAQARDLGANGVGAGLVVPVGVTRETWALTGNVGFAVPARADFYNLVNPAQALVGVALGVHLGPTLALRSETRLGAALVKNSHPGTASPAETTLSLRLRKDSGFGATVGAAMALSPGAGAARYRVFVDVGNAWGQAPKDTDGDALLDRDDACATEPETMNGWNDADGCPDGLADVTFTFLDEDGQPLEGVAVADAAGVALGTTNADGVLTIAGRMPGTTLGFVGTHAHMTDGKPASIALVEGANRADATLVWLPGRVRVVTRTVDHQPIVDAVAAFSGPAEVAPAAVAGGSQIYFLTAGSWRALVSAPTFGTERQEFDIGPDQTALMVIEIELVPAKVEVTAKEVRILDQVHFDFDKATIQADSDALLDEVANTLLANPQIAGVEVQGHTDDKGNDRYNLKLSQARVEAVRAYLIGRGVPADLLVARGYGETMPLLPNTSDANRAANRRVQVVILDAPPPSP
jgi:outer membrane protein OmpA-like peptidoglycan-associated protein